MKFRGNYRWIEAGKVEGAKRPTFIICSQEREFEGEQCEKVCAFAPRSLSTSEGGCERVLFREKIGPLSRAGEHIARSRSVVLSGSCALTLCLRMDFELERGAYTSDIIHNGVPPGQWDYLYNAIVERPSTLFLWISDVGRSGSFGVMHLDIMYQELLPLTCIPDPLAT